MDSPQTLSEWCQTHNLSSVESRLQDKAGIQTVLELQQISCDPSDVAQIIVDCGFNIGEKTRFKNAIQSFSKQTLQQPQQALPPPSHPLTLLINGTNYNILTELGRGGFGLVWKAIDPNTNGFVAIKTQLQSDLSTSKNWFTAEVESHKKISMHACVPRVPQLLASSIDPDEYIVMEFIPGDTADIHFKLAPEHILAGPKATMFLLKTLETLDAVHELGILHRDIKPSNILIHKYTLDPWIFDFGIARDLGLKAQSSVTDVGTLPFRPPEYLHRGVSNFGRFTDIFSLGATLLALTGNLTDNDLTWDTVLARCPWTNDLKTAVSKMIDLDVDKRFQNCQDAMKALKQTDPLVRQRESEQQEVAELNQQLLDAQIQSAKLQREALEIESNLKQEVQGHLDRFERCTNIIKDLMESEQQALDREAQLTQQLQEHRDGDSKLIQELLESQNQAEKSKQEALEREASLTQKFQEEQQDASQREAQLNQKLLEAQTQTEKLQEYQQHAFEREANLIQNFQEQQTLLQNDRATFKLLYSEKEQENIYQAKQIAKLEQEIADLKQNTKAYPPWAVSHPPSPVSQRPAAAIKLLPATPPAPEPLPVVFVPVPVSPIPLPAVVKPPPIPVHICVTPPAVVTPPIPSSPATPHRQRHDPTQTNPTKILTPTNRGVIDLGSIKELRTLQGHTGYVLCVCPLVDGTIATGSEDRTIKLWDPKTGQCIKTLHGHQGAVRTITQLIDGTIAIGSGDNIFLWDTKTGQLIKRIQGHGGHITSLVPLSNGTLASGSWDKTIKIWAWDSKTSTCITTLEGHKHEVTCITELSDGTLVSTSGDKTLKIWDFKTGQCLKTLEARQTSAFFSLLQLNSNLLEGHEESVSCVVELTDGTLASGSADNTIKIWDMNTGKCIKTLKGHSGAVESMIQLQNSSPVDGALATASFDDTIRIWDLKTGKSIKTLQGHSNWVRCIAQLEDGTIVSSSDDKTIKLWGNAR